MNPPWKSRFEWLQPWFLRSPNVTQIAWVLAFLGGLLSIAFLVTAAGNDPVWAKQYDTLLWLNLGIIVALLILVLALLSRLLLRLSKAKFGARLTLRFATALALLGLIPTGLVYLISVFFLNQSIDSGFNDQVGAALNAGLKLSRSTLNTQLNDLHHQAQIAATTLNLKGSLGEQVHALKAKYATDNPVDVLLFDTQAKVLASTGQSASKGLLSDVPQADDWQQLQKKGEFTHIESLANDHPILSSTDIDNSERLYLRAVVRIPKTSMYVQLTQGVSPAVAAMTGAVAQGVKDYELIKLGRNGLRTVYSTTLTIILLLVMLAAVAMSFVLADAMNAPLMRLARGIQAVTSGDFTLLSESSDHGDLSGLTRSFNRMLMDLSNARTGLTQNHAYLQQVLSSLTTGVLVLDAQQMLRSINPSGEKILGLTNPQLKASAEQQLPLAVWQTIVSKHDNPEWQAQIEHIAPAGDTQTLLLRAAPLVQNDGAGVLLVFDDVSKTMLAQKAQAWGEVAQRLAHEIKNPLTPIQLSAERLAMKLTDKLQGSDADLLRRGTATIVTQVAALKNMVDEFKQYARLPKAQLVPVNLDAFLAEQLLLYKETVSGDLNMGFAHPTVMADANQLRQVLHNLLGNALDAAQERYDKACKTALTVDALPIAPSVRLSTEHTVNSITLHIQDNGAGFSAGALAKLFEPYHTTKAEGTGLGLAIVHRIVQDHNAKISVKNTLDDRTGGVCGAQVAIVFARIV